MTSLKNVIRIKRSAFFAAAMLAFLGCGMFTTDGAAGMSARRKENLPPGTHRVGCGMFTTGAVANTSRKDNLPPETRRELAEVRRATAKYHNLSQALEDGYVDINVFIPHMGFHYLKPSFLDADFQRDKPELLVYAPDPFKNRLQLVAVEYAVPLDLSPTPPEGFTGEDDMWHRNEEFGLWTLHVWLWAENPDGIFAEFNPRVP